MNAPRGAEWNLEILQLNCTFSGKAPPCDNTPEQVNDSPGSSELKPNKQYDQNFTQTIICASYEWVNYDAHTQNFR